MGRNDQKKPKTIYFIVSNSTLFEINVVFIQWKPMFPIAHAETTPNHWVYDPEKVQNDVKREKKEERRDRNKKAMQL